MGNPKKVSEIRELIKQFRESIDNPFVKGWKYLVNKISAKRADGSYVEYDVMCTTQVMLNPGVEYRNDFLELSSGAKDLYWWILMEMDAGDSVVYVNRDHFIKKKSKGKKRLQPDTFRRLVNELESVEFIYRVRSDVSDDIFVVNPRLAFRGSRLKYFPGHKEYRK